SGNVAKSSQGSVQVGGSNTSKNSAATVQTSSIHGSPSATVNGKVARAKATAPATIPGNAPNSASGSIGSVQVGGGHSSHDALLAVGVNRPRAQPAVSHGGSVTVKRQYNANLQQLLLQAQWLGVQPSFFLAADPIAEMTLGGWAGSSPNGGNALTESPGTAQTGPIGASPKLAVGSKSPGSSVA